MLHQRANAFARENEVLRQEIQPIFFPGSSLQIAGEDSIQSDGDLARAADRFTSWRYLITMRFGSVFTISAQGFC